MKKILILYAQYGSGHKSIAEYVAKYISEHNEVEVKLLDMTSYCNFIGKVGLKLYNWVLTHRKEKIFDIAYEIMDHKLTTALNNRISKKSFDNENLREDITEFNPNITISTHFFCSNIISHYNKLNLINSKIYTIITDYHTHELWTKNWQNEDGYIVANEIVKEELIKKGVSANKIFPYGLPLNITALQKLEDNNTIYKRYNIPSNKPVYLFFGGSSSGSMYYFDYLKIICKLNYDIYIIFICGKNQKLKEKSDAFIKDNNLKNVQVLGYSTDVLNLMKISNLVITKPGGATVTECLEMKVPMLLVPGVGGQEKYNAKFIHKRKYGIRVRGKFSFKRALKKIIANPSILQNMQKRLQKLDNNTSVEKINNLISKN